MASVFGAARRPFYGLAIAMCGVVTMQSAALAHVTLATKETRTNASYKAILQIPHGCNGEATRGVRIQIPEGVIAVKPMPKPGWTLKVTRGDYARSYQSHGRAVTAGVKEISWSGGELSDDHYDEFVFASFVAGDFAAGSAVYFPTVQSCAKGENRWVDVPAGAQSAHDLKSPAPALRIVSEVSTASEKSVDHSAHAATSGADTFKIGELTVTTPWTRATPGGAKIAGGYLKITNNGSASDRLLGAATTAAARVEIHEMSMTDGVMKMRPLPNGLDVKPGETVELKPGGYHMMFMDLKQPLKQGETVKATLRFEKAGTLDVNFNVNAIGATGQHKHHH